MTSVRAWRWWLVGGAVIVLLVLTIAVTLARLVERYGPALTRDRVEAALGTALGRPVRIERVDLAPWLGRVTVEGVTVAARDGEGAGTLLRLGRAEARVGIASLWRRQLFVSSLTLDDPDVRLDDAGAGGAGLALPDPLPDSIRVGPITIGIGRIVVRRAHVAVRSPGAGRAVEAEGLDATAWPDRGGVRLALSVVRLRVRTPDLDEVVQIVEGAGALRGRRADVGALRARWRGEELSLVGAMRDWGAGLELRVRGRLPLDGVAKLAGAGWPVAGVARVDGTVRGALAAPNVSASVAVPSLEAGPIRARAASGRLQWSKDGRLRLDDVRAEALGGTVRGSLAVTVERPETLRASFHLAGVSLEALESLAGRGSGVKGAVTVDGEAAGDPRRVERMTGSARFASPALVLPGELGKLGPAAASGEARLAGGGVEIDGLEARWPSARLLARGRVGLDGALALQATAGGDLGKIAAVWGERDVAGQATVTADVRGRWDRPAASGSLQGSALSARGVSLDAVALPFSLADDTLRIENGELRRRASTVRLAATATWTGPRAPARWREAVRGRLEVTAASVRLEDLGPLLPAEWRAGGQASLTGRAEGTPAAWQATGRLAAASLTVRGQRLDELEAPLALSAAGFESRQLRARVAGVPVAGEARGGWDGAAEAHLDLGPASLAALPGVADAVPAAGTARARADLSVKMGAVSGSAVIAAERVALAGLALGRGAARVSLQASSLAVDVDFPESRVSLAARGRLAEGERIAVSLKADGVDVEPLARRWAPSALGPVRGQASVVAQAALPFWQPSAAQVDSAVIEAAGLAVGDLAVGRGTAKLTVRDRVLAAELALPDRKASVTASGRLAAGASLRVAARVEALGLTPLVRGRLPDAMGPVEVTVSAVADLAVPVSNPAGVEGTVRLEPVTLTLGGEAWQGSAVLHRQPSRVRVERLDLRSRLGAVTVTGTVGDAGALDLAGEGQFPLGIAPALRPELREASGVVDARIRVAGTTAAPQLAGEGTVRDARLLLRDYPEPIRDLRARFAISPRSARVTEATASFGGGQVRAAGDVAFGAAGVGAYRFTAAAREVTPAPVAGARTTWDADLELVGQASRALVRGEARLVRGSYTRDISLLQTLLEPRPVRAEAAGGIHLDVRVALQDAMAVRTAVARFDAGGTLRLQGTTAAPIVFGAVDARQGELVFRKNKFTLTSASARFIDPRRIDPILDVRGKADIGGYEVTLSMTGPAENLEIRFSSVPPLPEEDVLSLVAFGRTRQQLGQAGAGAFVGEAAGFIIQDLFGGQGNVTGLDVMELDSAPGDERTLKVGKRLTPRTLVTYSQGLTNTDQRRLRIEYQVFGPLVVAGEQDFRGGFGGDVLLRVRFR